MSIKIIFLFKKLVFIFITSFIFCGYIFSSSTLLIKKKSKIAFIGNNFAERMRLYNFLEAAIHIQYPKHKLTIRNMGWSGDTVNVRNRAKGVEDILKNLSWYSPSLVFAFYGMVESFRNESYLPSWKSHFSKFIQKLKALNSDVEIVIVSPIAHEYIEKKGLPSKGYVDKRNDIISKYVKVMKEFSDSKGYIFIDLFTLSTQIIENEKIPLTINGIHQNEYGDMLLSKALVKELGWEMQQKKSKSTEEINEKIKSFLSHIYEKNYYYYLTWRPANTVHLWGNRYHAWAKDKPLFELEQISLMTEKIDKEIWKSKKLALSDLFAVNLTLNSPLWNSINPDRHKSDFVPISKIYPPRKGNIRLNKLFYRKHPRR